MSRENRADHLELLTPSQMGEADRLTIKAGTPGRDLMENAGRLVAEQARAMAAAGGRILILCGPGNNGGDGFVAARLLRQEGFSVAVCLLKDPDGLKGDARLAFEDMEQAGGAPCYERIDQIDLRAGLDAADVIIDALLGAGLDRPLAGTLADIVGAVNDSGAKVLAVDLPTGINGATGEVMGVAIKAAATITFFRFKPGHYLYPGRAHCGQLHCGDIGIQSSVFDRVRLDSFLNIPSLWRGSWQEPQPTGHKYSRGHAIVFGGPVRCTGAARLAAGAALRAGAGLVTVACPPSALAVYASQLTAVMVRPVSGTEGISDLLSDKRLNAALLGPGYGVGTETCEAVEAVLKAGCATVLDADALTSFQTAPERLFTAIRETKAQVVLTPHGGEFSRLFPDLSGRDRLAAARLAAERSGAILLLKGPDTIIAEPQGRAAINANASAWLATAGAGDVLAGIVTALLAQYMPGFEAAAMAVWLHSEAGNAAGPGLIAEDLSPALKPVIAALVEKSSAREGV